MLRTAKSHREGDPEEILTLDVVFRERKERRYGELRVEDGYIN